ncbi:MAG: hypothetical protein ACRC62_04725 [Microcoleus sp.]
MGRKVSIHWGKPDPGRTECELLNQSKKIFEVSVDSVAYSIFGDFKEFEYAEFDGKDGEQIAEFASQDNGFGSSKFVPLFN